MMDIRNKTLFMYVSRTHFWRPPDEKAVKNRRQPLSVRERFRP
jgi:hypothetical protein